MLNAPESFTNEPSNYLSLWHKISEGTATAPSGPTLAPGLYCLYVGKTLTTKWSIAILLLGKDEPAYIF